MAKPDEGIQVTVIGREEITTYPKIATPVVHVQVTYVAGGRPPATVRIPKDQYNPESEKRAIREDIERVKKRRTETFRV